MYRTMINTFFLKLLNKLNLLEKLNVKVPISIEGELFTIPVIGKSGYSNVFMSEPWMIGLLHKILALNEGTFVDVGVNIGQTLLKLRSVNKDVNYVGFEPNPFCVNYSSTLIEINKIQNSVLMPFGVSNKTEVGVLNFFAKGATDSTASMISDFRQDQKIERKVFIPLFECNEISRHLGDKVGFLKIDVEGAELEVLQSFKERIKKDNPFIFIEILPVYTADNNTRLTRQAKIEEILKECDYSIMRIIKEDNHVSQLDRLDSFGIHSNLEYCDYVCVPNFMAEKVVSIKY